MIRLALDKKVPEIDKRTLYMYWPRVVYSVHMAATKSGISKQTESNSHFCGLFWTFVHTQARPGVTPRVDRGERE